MAPGPDPEPPRATEITLRPDRLNFDALGESAQVEAVVLDQFGSAMSSAEVAWSTSAADVASVDGSGLVTAVGVGEASIRASSGGASALTSVIVEQRIAALAFRSELQGGTTRGFASPVEVEVLDEQRNRVPGSGQPTVMLSVAANEPGGRLLGTTETQAVDAVATFESIRFDRIGDGYALTASAGDVTTTSSEFSVEIPVCGVARGPRPVPVAAGGDYVEDDAAVPELPGSVIQVDGQDALDIGGGLVGAPRSWETSTATVGRTWPIRRPSGLRWRPRCPTSSS